MKLERPRGADRVTPCVLHEAVEAGPYLHMYFETARALPCGAGDRLQLVDEASTLPALVVTQLDPESLSVEALWRRPEPSLVPPWLAGNVLGHEFAVVGPLDATDGSIQVTEQSPPETDPQLWAELLDGQRVRAVLEDFYSLVYQDPVLSPYFKGVTRSRSVDKQYSFLRQLMTGERIYFGDRPRNAHHWMVIPEAMFDHRQALMQDTLRRHGLSDAQRARWMRLEAHYRRDIVKSAAWPRRVNGQDIPLDGHERQILDEGTVCDHCGDAIAAGVEVTYHRRLGVVSCHACAAAVP